MPLGTENGFVPRAVGKAGFWHGALAGQGWLGQDGGVGGRGLWDRAVEWEEGVCGVGGRGLSEAKA